MQLSQQDSLRINVLLHQPLDAVRIDDGKMIVYGLTKKGEAKIELNPNCKDEVYIKRVKEVISSHVLGSPGGYPVFLKRWTRMGQARADSLENLLKLGEPEAVVAVVGAQGITNEIARRAWWVMPNSENARSMLANEAVVNGDMGKVLAEFLLEFLPFEEEPRNIIESVRLVLQPGLVSEDVCKELWKKGQRKNAFLVGFLKTDEHTIPEQADEHALLSQWQAKLSDLAAKENKYAGLLLEILKPEGQAYFKTIEAVLKKPANQDVVVALFEAIEGRFNLIRPHDEKRRDIEQIVNEAKKYCSECSNDEDKIALEQINILCPELLSMLENLMILSFVGEQLVAPIFATTDAVGSVMRRKIEPVTKPLTSCLNVLMN